VYLQEQIEKLNYISQCTTNDYNDRCRVQTHCQQKNEYGMLFW